MLHDLEPEDQWDQTLIRDLLDKVDHRNVDVFLIPGRYWSNAVHEINQKINDCDNVLVVITSDEEAWFPIERLSHPNMVIYQQTPHTDKPKLADRYIPIGYPPETRHLLRAYSGLERPLGFFFSGQINHPRREQAYEQLQHMAGGLANRTGSFTDGLSQAEYFSYMVNAKVVPCPSGAVIPESFRIWEALEAGCVPVVDRYDPYGKSEGYWELLLGEYDFPLLDEWEDAPGTIDFFIDTYPERQNRVFAWWQKYKRDLRVQLQADMNRIAQPRFDPVDSRVTVLVPTSPIKEHPDTRHIDETIASIRHHLPYSEIIIMIDGCREEQSDYADNYQEYIRRLLWKTNHVWDKVTPLLFDEHTHQALMTRAALTHVLTPCILFMEHDTPLVTDYEIPFFAAIETLTKDHLDIVRFLHEAEIHDDHRHLMVDTEPQDMGLPILRTAQWSQRPHLARTSYYRKLVDDNFTDESRTMIEDAVHGITQQAFLERGKAGWNDHRIGIYAPEGNMKRSYTTDGRGEDPKFSMVYK